MAKNIVCLSNGTWNEWKSGHDTNVERLCRMLDDRQPVKQVVKYDDGVGTGFFRLTGGALGVGLSKNVRELYTYIAEQYEPGDRIYLFGFSRGAFTVRSLGGMIRKCGIVKNPTDDLVERVFDAYTSDKRAEDISFKVADENSLKAVHVIGVWDTVGALGVPFKLLNRLNPWSHRFHDTELSADVPFAFQALSIDDERSVFEPTLWTSKPVPGQVVEQVWFIGAHSDVGGGVATRSLSDIALEWMYERLRSHQVGLVFKKHFEKPPPPFLGNHRGTISNSRKHIYRLWPAKRREIPEGSLVHTTVRDRMNSDPSYKTGNLPMTKIWVDNVVLPVAAGGTDVDVPSTSKPREAGV